MRPIISLLTASRLRLPLFILFVILLYAYAWRPIEAVQDLVVQGDYAYLAVGEDGIRILNLGVEDNPQEVAHYDLGGFAHSVAFYNSYLYVANGGDGLRVLDVNILSDIRDVGRLGPRGSTLRVVVSGEYAFLQDTRSGVRVVSLRTPHYPQEVHVLPTRSLITALAAHGNLLATANENKELFVYDLVNPEQPQERGVISLPVAVRDMATDGRYIYAAGGDEGIIIFDAGNPGGIQKVGQVATNGPALGFDRYATFGFVSLGDKGVQVFDLTNPRSLRPVGSYTGISSVRAVFAAYQRAYLAADLYGMESISYQVRMDPLQVGQTSVPPFILDVSVRDNLAFLASGEAGLRVLHVGDPAFPLQVNEFDTQGYAARILVAGDLAFIADQTGGIVTIDISTPLNALRPVSVVSTTFQANSIAKSGNLIFVAEGAGGMRILNYRNPYEPEAVSRIVTGGTALDVVVMADHAYLADGIGGLRIIYMGNPAEPRIQSTYDTPGDARAVFVHEDRGAAVRVAFAYIADGSRGLRIVNVSDPRTPLGVSSLELTGFAQDIVVLDNIAYLAMGDKGIALVDVSDPVQPVYLGHFETPGEAVSVVVHEDLVYIADNSRGLSILGHPGSLETLDHLSSFDAPHAVLAAYAESAYVYVTDGAVGLWTLSISQPEKMQTLGLEPLTGQPGQMVMTDWGVLMVAAGDAGVHFVDIGSPSGAKRIGTLDTPGTVMGMEARGIQGYLADGLAGIHIIDFLEPERPLLISSLNTDGFAYDIALSGGYAIVADGPAGLLAVRISEIRNPAKVSMLGELRDARGLEIAGNYAFVAGGEEGLWVVNIEHPLTMQAVAQLPVEGRAVDVKIAGSYAFVASDTHGLVIYDITDPLNLQVVGATATEVPAASVTIFNQSRSTDQPKAFQALISTGRQGLLIYDVNEKMALSRLSHYDTPGIASLTQILQAVLFSLEMRFDEISPRVGRTFFQIALDMGLFGLVSFVVWLLAIGQFVLPISSRRQSMELIKRLIFYLVGLHGPAVRVREGKIIQSSEEQRRIGLGVALVDLSSAVVLEPRMFSPAQMRESPGWDHDSEIFDPERAGRGAISVHGPGIVFTNWFERVRSVVDLRPQIRVQPGISAYTSDGIEALTNIFCVFSLGEPPTVYQVAYEGEPGVDNVRFVMLTEQECPPARPGDSNQKVKFVAKFVDELDNVDKAEVHRYIQSRARHSLPDQDATDPRATRSPAPFVCDPDRVFAAVYSQALQPSTGDKTEWYDLPAQVAVDVFRDLLTRQTYDALYSSPGKPEVFPLPAVKNRFARQLKNTGVMSFQYVHRVDNRPLEEGQLIPVNELVYYPVQKFQSPKVLRVRGIKVISAGFTELRPAHGAVRPHQLAKWSAAWEADTVSGRAKHELQAMRIRNEARSNAQSNMALTLSELFKNEQMTEEALAMRVFQALETVAADPVTRKLLPAETISMLSNLQFWLASQ